MTEVSRFWTGTTPGDAGPYSADQFSHVLELLLHASDDKSGVIIDSDPSVAFSLRVRATSPASTNVEVTAGAALVDGTFYENTATLTFAIAANASGNARIDTIVLQKDWATQTVRAVVKQGTPAASPVPATLTLSSGVMWEIPLADIAVANGFSSIANTDITHRNTFANMSPGSVINGVTNNSGGVLNDGDVVVWDNTGIRYVTTTTQGGNTALAGVWAAGRANNGDVGRVLVRGYALVTVQSTPAAAAIGSRVEAGTTAKQARTAANGNLGRVVDVTTYGRPLVYVDVQNRSRDYVLIKDEKASGTASGTFTSGAWQTRDLNTEVVDTGNMATISSNQITLQPGTYEVKWSCPARNVGQHQSRLQNITAGTTTHLGSSENTSLQGTTATEVSTRSFGYGRFTISTATVFELQHQCNTTQATRGFGSAAGFGANEVYSIIEFWKES